MESKKINSTSPLLWFRAMLIVGAFTLFFGLRFHVSDMLFFCVVIFPIVLVFVFSFWSFFTEYKSRLIAFSLPVALTYLLGFSPWISNFHEVSISSSTAVLDFVIIPMWSMIYGGILLALHELILQILLWVRGDSGSRRL